MVLYFPAHSSLFAVPGPARPQRAVYQGDRVPGGLGCVLCRRPVSSVAFSTNGVRKVMYRDIVDWSTSKMSAHTSSIMFCRRYPQVTTSASRKVSSRGRPVPLSHGSSSSPSTRYSSSPSCSSSSPDIRSNRNGFSVVERFGVVTSFLSAGEAVVYHLMRRVAGFLEILGQSSGAGLVGVSHNLQASRIGRRRLDL